MRAQIIKSNNSTVMTWGNRRVATHNDESVALAGSRIYLLILCPKYRGDVGQSSCAQWEGFGAPYPYIMCLDWRSYICLASANILEIIPNSSTDVAY